MQLENSHLFPDGKKEQPNVLFESSVELLITVCEYLSIRDTPMDNFAPAKTCFPSPARHLGLTRAESYDVLRMALVQSLVVLSPN